jgi:hypothetical protein
MMSTVNVGFKIIRLMMLNPEKEVYHQFPLVVTEGTTPAEVMMGVWDADSRWLKLEGPSGVHLFNKLYVVHLQIADPIVEHKSLIDWAMKHYRLKPPEA